MFRNQQFSRQERRGPRPQKYASEETSIRTEKIQVERKSFQFSLKENPRGRFLKITEDVGGRRDTIIIPATGLEDFQKALEEMLEASSEAGPPPEPDIPEARD